MKQATGQWLLMSVAYVLMWGNVTATVHAHGGEASLIHACVKKSGALRIISPTATCNANETPLDWHIQGSPGASSFPITCPPDSVPVGTTCVDKYEASVWQIPSGSSALIDKVKSGTVTLADLQAGGGVQRGAIADDYACNDNGNDCTDHYAVSVLGFTPSARVTWFQAQQFCRAAGKRLLTNAEWQTAAAGTPDGDPCIVFALSVGPTGIFNCVSHAGVYDMVGNVWEWVADWTPTATSCSTSLFGTYDANCMAIDPAYGVRFGPAALIRGGGFLSGPSAGVFALLAFTSPSWWESPPLQEPIGFRCAR